MIVDLIEISAKGLKQLKLFNQRHSCCSVEHFQKSIYNLCLIIVGVLHPCFIVIAGRGSRYMHSRSLLTRIVEKPTNNPAGIAKLAIIVASLIPYMVRRLLM